MLQKYQYLYEMIFKTTKNKKSSRLCKICSAFTQLQIIFKLQMKYL